MLWTEGPRPSITSITNTHQHKHLAARADSLSLDYCLWLSIHPPSGAAPAQLASQTSTDSSSSSSTVSLVSLVSATMALAPSRRDGRSANQIRPLAAEQGILNRADGSARFVQGNTSVLAAVYGPAPAKSARLERADGATVDVNFKSENGMINSAQTDGERSALLRRSLEEVVLRSRYPRTVVSVVIQVRVCVYVCVLPHTYSSSSICSRYHRELICAAAVVVAQRR